MGQVISSTFDELDDARLTVEELVEAGIDPEDIGLVTSDPEGNYATHLKTHSIKIDETLSDDELDGAVTGGAIGGLAGILLGLGVFMLPGVGPVIAAGPVASAIVGLAAGSISGGLVGAIIDWDIPEQEAERYAEAIRQGETLVSVHTSDKYDVDRVRSIMTRHHPAKVEQH